MMHTLVMAEAVVRFFVRLPEDVHAHLVARAKAENRSLNNLIVTWIRRCIAEGW